MEVIVRSRVTTKGESSEAKVLDCPACEVSDMIYVRYTCTVDFDCAWLEDGSSSGIGYSMDTAGNIIPIGDSVLMCGACGTPLERPTDTLLIQDV
jgi:hypothetical protein